MLMEDMSRNKRFFQVRLSHVLRFIFLYNLFHSRKDSLQRFAVFFRRDVALCEKFNFLSVKIN
jgi:hypothetical protein